LNFEEYKARIEKERRLEIEGIISIGVREVEEEDAWKMWKKIGDREAGILRPKSFANRIKSNRIRTLQLSNHKDIVSPHRGSINSLQVALFYSIYLLLS
jgi:hypothetical protein